MTLQTIIKAIDQAPLNRGLKGVDWVADPRNIAYVEDDDVVLFDYEDEGFYQVHVLLGTSRGKAARDFINRAFDGLFHQDGGEVVFALVPDDRRDVKLMARWCGMKSCGMRKTINGMCELFLRRKETIQ